MTAALQVKGAAGRGRPAGPAESSGRTLRCLIMDDNGFDRRAVRRIAEGSRFSIEFIETTGIAETRKALASGRADVLLLDYRVPDGDGIAFASELGRDERHAGTPIVIVTGDGSERAAVQAIRSGVADYLCKDGLSSADFDRAIGNALRRGAAIAAADQSERIAELTAENSTLRRAALVNMRQLKAQLLPLLSFAWRALRGERLRDADRQSVAQDLARATRGLLGLVDDTVLFAATHRQSEIAGPVDLCEVLSAILRDEGGKIGESGARVRVGAMPVLRAKASQILLLFEELLLNAGRNAIPGGSPEVEIGSGVDTDGNPIIWLTERGAALPARREAAAERFGSLSPDRRLGKQDEYAWSLCQHIVQKNQGQFRIAQGDGDDCTVRMRFPRSMLA